LEQWLQDVQQPLQVSGDQAFLRQQWLQDVQQPMQVSGDRAFLRPAVHLVEQLFVVQLLHHCAQVPQLEQLLLQTYEIYSQTKPEQKSS
jgi:hypothetical protein